MVLWLWAAFEEAIVTQPKATLLQCFLQRGQGWAVAATFLLYHLLHMRLVQEGVPQRHRDGVEEEERSPPSALGVPLSS